MNTSSPSPTAKPTISTPTARLNPISEELTEVKRALLQAEIRLAKARATVSGAEADVKVYNAQLKALTK